VPELTSKVYKLISTHLLLTELQKKSASDSLVIAFIISLRNIRPGMYFFVGSGHSSVAYYNGPGAVFITVCAEVL